MVRWSNITRLNLFYRSMVSTWCLVCLFLWLLSGLLSSVRYPMARRPNPVAPGWGFRHQTYYFAILIPRDLEILAHTFSSDTLCRILFHHSVRLDRSVSLPFVQVWRISVAVLLRQATSWISYSDELLSTTRICMRAVSFIRQWCLLFCLHWRIGQRSDERIL